MKTHPIILGTAGHIDHGKTALVQALTGIDTDRLKVEKERGITTELGFAHLDLGERRYGFVDVPGHERFIKAMVAGAGGLDLVVLAIAADEGIMPQTREHLDICELLGVRRGVVALTKSDLVDSEWLALMAEEVGDGLAGSFLADAARIPVSAKTGVGLDSLRAEFLRLAEDIPARAADGLFRLPIDRVFSIHGFGTVVTGTIVSGTVRAGDTVSVQPRGIDAKVRGLQLHGEPAERAPAGVRCALNLSGVGTAELARGDWLAHPGSIEPSHLIDARLRYLRTSRAPLERRSRVLLHHGTTQVLASLVLIDRDQLAPGDDGLVQLRIDQREPLTALPGDHFIVRGFTVQEHYGTTLGGGEVLRVHAPKVRRSAAAAKAMVARIADAAPAERVALEVKAADVAGLEASALTARLGLSEADRNLRLGELVGAGELIKVGKGATALLCHAEPFARLEKLARARIDEHHEAHPEHEGIPREELRGRLPAALAPRMYEVVLDALVRRGAIAVDRDRVRAAKRARPGSGERSKLAAQLADAMRGWSWTPPRPKDLPGALGAESAEVRAAAESLIKAGELVRVKPDLFVHRGALDELAAKLRAYLSERGEIAPSEWKELTGASRKYSIPLAEYFDQTKLTLRVGDLRKLR